MISLWNKTTQLPSFPRLTGDASTGVLIIGGGITGILCAYMMHQARVPYLLVEADSICRKTSGNTTAKITSQHGLIYAKLLRQLGREKARMYLDANEDALRTYRRLAQEFPCGFEEKNAYVYSPYQRKPLEEELRALHQLGYPATLDEDTPLTFPVAGAVGFPNQAQFHPLEFVRQIVPDLHIHEHTPVVDVENQYARTPYGTITADHIISATHFPVTDRHGLYFMKLYQQRSYVLALENAGDVQGMYIDPMPGGLSFRNYDNLLLLGGGGHRTGKQGGKWDKLRSFARCHYPRSRVAYVWAAQDCMSLDQIPYIGRYSSRASHLYVASGFNKWGMTSAMAAAKILTDMVQGRENPYAAVFSPARSMLRPQLLINGWEFAARFFTPSSQRCSHMGCSLRWNSHEHTWDCPCHGSRFTENGYLIETPAMKNLDE